jgi:NADPH:quinone reductase-like Zn-dependent oxidoreductase
MLAARLNVKTVTLSLDDVPIPEPGPGQVRVKVRAAGVCLSDVHLIEGSIRPRYLQQDTVTLGHEIAGTIDALGPGVTGYTVGQRVLLQAGEERDGVLYARGADYDGGWAEYTLATAATLVPIPGGLPFEQAAIIPDAVSTSWAAWAPTRSSFCACPGPLRSSPSTPCPPPETGRWTSARTPPSTPPTRSWSPRRCVTSSGTSGRRTRGCCCSTVSARR